MKRKDKIIKEAKNRYPYIKGLPQNSSNQAVFVEAAEWADKTMVERAVAWMKEQVYQEYGGGPLERLISDERIEDFRKAMFEEE